MISSVPGTQGAVHSALANKLESALLPSFDGIVRPMMVPIRTSETTTVVVTHPFRFLARCTHEAEVVIGNSVYDSFVMVNEIWGVV